MLLRHQSQDGGFICQPSSPEQPADSPFKGTQGQVQTAVMTWTMNPCAAVSAFMFACPNVNWLYDRALCWFWCLLRPVHSLHIQLLLHHVVLHLLFTIAPRGMPWHFPGGGRRRRQSRTCFCAGYMTFAFSSSLICKSAMTCHAISFVQGKVWVAQGSLQTILDIIMFPGLPGNAACIWFAQDICPSMPSNGAALIDEPASH